MVLLGLSGENMFRLMADKPITFSLAELGLPDVQVVIVGGHSEQAIVAQLARLGAAPRVAAPPTPPPPIPGEPCVYGCGVSTGWRHYRRVGWQRVCADKGSESVGDYVPDQVADLQPVPAEQDAMPAAEEPSPAGLATPASAIADALHHNLCEHPNRTPAGMLVMPAHDELAAAILTWLARHGQTVVPARSVAHADQMTGLLRDVADELGEQGRIGRSLLHGSNPNAANVACQELLDRLASLRGRRRG
jgi:plasmid stabilization system protein ParE